MVVRRVQRGKLTPPDRAGKVAARVNRVSQAEHEAAMATAAANKPKTEADAKGVVAVAETTKLPKGMTVAQAVGFILNNENIKVEDLTKLRQATYDRHAAMDRTLAKTFKGDGTEVVEFDDKDGVAIRGRVMKVADRNLKVAVGEDLWTLSPTSVRRVVEQPAA